MTASYRAQHQSYELFGRHLDRLALYPELMAELGAAKRERIGGWPISDYGSA